MTIDAAVIGCGGSFVTIDVALAVHREVFVGCDDGDATIDVAFIECGERLADVDGGLHRPSHEFRHD